MSREKKSSRSVGTRGGEKSSRAGKKTSRSEKPFSSSASKKNSKSVSSKTDKPKPVDRKFKSRTEYKPAMFIDRANKSEDKRTKPETEESGKKKFTAKPTRSKIDGKITYVKKAKGDPLPSFSSDVILNKYISNAGICSRREADVMISTGIVQVNGVVVTELGYKVKPDDIVKYDGATIRSEKKQYVLLNKPKDFITTMDDPMNRKTVMQLVAKACKERIYPVGRLDRNTTGLLLFTNDGDLAKKLTHPRYEIKKLYHVETAEVVTVAQIQALLNGVELDDGGFVKADKAEIIKESKNREVGIEIHSGKYRVVRRMFESLGHNVKKLDRVSFAGLTKKDLPRGTYRHLTEQEVSFLRML